MPPLIAGLPLHPLVVHAVVVLVPLAVLGTIIVAVWPAARARYGWLTVGVTAVAAAATPIAMDSGDQLRSRVHDNAMIAQHAQLGDQLFFLVLPLFVVVTALMCVHYARTRAERAERSEGTGAIAAQPARWVRPTAITLSVLTIALATVSAVQVVRIGDSGARAAWSDTVQPPQG